MPGVENIYVPGEIENEIMQQRARTGLNIEDETWEALGRNAQELNVAVPAT